MTPQMRFADALIPMLAVQFHVTEPQEHGVARQVLHADGEALDLDRPTVQAISSVQRANVLDRGKMPKLSALLAVEPGAAAKPVALVWAVDGDQLEAAERVLARLVRLD